MTKTWVGSTVAIIMLLASVGAGVSAPSPSGQSDDFENPKADRWELIRGDLSFETGLGWAGDPLTWMVVKDGDFGDAGPPRVRADAAHTEGNETFWNTESAAYRLSVTLQRDSNYEAPATNETAEETNETTDAGLKTSSGDINVTLDANVSLGYAPLALTFDMASDHANATNLTWNLYPDQNSSAIASGSGLPANATHTYAAAGEHTARIAVSNGTHAGFATILIVVEEVPQPDPEPLLPEGAIGITFGEQDGDGYYLAAWTDDGFRLGIPDGSGEFTTDVDMAGWGGIPTRHQKIDERQRYEVQVEDTTVMVLVNNVVLGSFALPGIPIGTFGVITAEGTRVNVGEVHWQLLDRSAPEIEIVRPVAGSLYVQDHHFEYAGGGTTFVQGDLTLIADITDDATGPAWAQLYVDGNYQSTVFGPGIETHLKVATGGLSTGYHTVTVKASDQAGNLRTADVEIFVLGTQIPNDNTVESAGRLVVDTLPDL